MLGASIDLELLYHLTAERVVREHTLHSLLNNIGRIVIQHIAQCVSTETTRVTGMAVQLDLVALISGNSDLFSVDDDDKVAAVDVGGIGGLVLPTE